MCLFALKNKPENTGNCERALYPVELVLFRLIK